jgi:hypothetical protein
MSYRVFHNPTQVTLAGTAIGPVTDISWTVEAKEILASGDDDYHCSVCRHGRRVLRGTIEMLDVEAGQELAGRRGLLTFIINDAQGPRQVELPDCSMGRADLSVRHRNRPACRVGFLCEATPYFSAPD